MNRTDRPLADLADAVELLERAIAYARGRLVGVSPALLGAPTPCRDWDLGQLLDHLDDSLAAFTEACSGVVALAAAPSWGQPDVVPRIHARAGAVLGAWTAVLGAGAATPPDVRVGDRVVGCTCLVSAGALEIAVHGWDVGRSVSWTTGASSPAEHMPDALAARLLSPARQLVTHADRPRRFAAPVTPRYASRAGLPSTPGGPPEAGSTAAGQLLGFLGRIV